MTTRQWQSKVRKWARRLNMAEVPIAVSVDDGPDMDRKWAEVSFDDARATRWSIRFRRDVPQPDEVVVHELLHVKSGLLDARDEAWIVDVSRAIVAGWRKQK